jgi:hypothetical protein
MADDISGGGYFVGGVVALAIGILGFWHFSNRHAHIIILGLCVLLIAIGAWFIYHTAIKKKT